jgi:hypothetical protein
VLACCVDDANSAPVDDVNNGDGADDNVDGRDDFSTFQARTYVGVFSPGFSILDDVEFDVVGSWQHLHHSSNPTDVFAPNDGDTISHGNIF